MSWRYVFNVTQKPVNKQRYWMALTLVRPNSACVGVAYAMNNISNVKVHLKTRSGNVNISVVEVILSNRMKGYKQMNVK